MTEPARLKIYGYVDRPYEAVRAVLRSRADDVLQQATNRASERMRGLIARLHVGAAGVDIAVDVRVVVTGKPDDPPIAGLPPVSHVGLAWKAATGSGLFPSMTADLSVSPLTFAETRVELEGTYRPPLAGVGKALDDFAGHRVAEAAVHHLVDEVIAELHREIPAKT